MKSGKTDNGKTYLMHLRGGGMRKITVPASWKVTFGPLVPPKDRAPHTTTVDRGFALRFYEGKDQQRAVFTDVESFRDESLVVMERVTKTKRQVVQKEAKSGSRDVVVEARVTEWVDPVAPDDGKDEEFLKIEDLR